MKLAILNGPPPQKPTAQSSREWYRVTNEASSPAADVFIYDSIGKNPWDDSGIEAKRFIDDLNAIDKSKAINLHINCPGGSVWDGLPIHNAIRARGNVTTNIEGIALSTGSWIGLGAVKVNIAKNSMMMIHKASVMWASGNSEDMEKIKEQLEIHDSVIAQMLADKCGKTKEEMLELMEDETWFNSEGAKEIGLVDEITDAVQVNNTFDLSAFRRVPDALGGKPAPATNQKQKGTNMPDIITPPAGTAPATPQVNNNPPANDNAEAAKLIKALHDEREAMNREIETMRKTRIGNKVQDLIDQARITVDQKEFWIKQAMGDEAVLEKLAALPQNLPGIQPLGRIETVSADIQNIVREMTIKQDPRNQDSTVYMDIAKRCSRAWHENKTKIRAVMNTNTLSSTFQQTVILQEILEEFRADTITLDAFSKNYSNVPLLGLDTVSVQYYALESAASTNWSSTDGYVAGDTTQSYKNVTINKRKYQGFELTSSEAARQPYFNRLEQAKLKAWKLADDVVADILTLITAAKYGAAVFTGLPGVFDSDDISDIGEACTTAKWPKIGRNLILRETYITPLTKESAIKSVANSGSAQALRDGVVTRIAGFDIREFASLPSNSENLVGFACFPSAILVAMSPIKPDDGVLANLVNYQAVTDPQTGLTLEYRKIGDGWKDKVGEFVECNYGYKECITAAGKRLVSA